MSKRKAAAAPADSGVAEGKRRADPEIVLSSEAADDGLEAFIDFGDDGGGGGDALGLEQALGEGEDELDAADLEDVADGLGGHDN